MCVADGEPAQHFVDRGLQTHASRIVVFLTVEHTYLVTFADGVIQPFLESFTHLAARRILRSVPQVFDNTVDYHRLRVLSECWFCLYLLFHN